MGKHKKPRTHVPNPDGSPLLRPDKNLNLDVGDNAKFLKVSRTVMNLPSINAYNPDEVVDRINLFFEIHEELDVKPTSAGFAMALGMDRRRLSEVRNDLQVHGFNNLPTTVRDIIKKGLMILENLLEQYMQNGKIHPTAGIFLAVNNHGYSNTSEKVITTRVEVEDYSTDDIKKRYGVDDTKIVEPIEVKPTTD